MTELVLSTNDIGSKGATVIALKAQAVKANKTLTSLSPCTCRESFFGFRMRHDNCLWHDNCHSSFPVHFHSCLSFSVDLHVVVGEVHPHHTCCVFRV
jgi:hypothetical protein